MHVPVLLIRSGGEISVRDIVEQLHRVHTHAEPVLAGITRPIRQSRCRQTTPTGEIANAVSGPDSAGVLGSAVSAGAISHQGLYHRCQVHSRRDLHYLKKTDPEDEALVP